MAIGGVELAREDEAVDENDERRSIDKDVL